MTEYKLSCLPQTSTKGTRVTWQEVNVNLPKSPFSDDLWFQSEARVSFSQTCNQRLTLCTEQGVHLLSDHKSHPLLVIGEKSGFRHSVFWILSVSQIWRTPAESSCCSSATVPVPSHPGVSSDLCIWREAVNHNNLNNMNMKVDNVMCLWGKPIYLKEALPFRALQQEFRLNWLLSKCERTHPPL